MSARVDVVIVTHNSAAHLVDAVAPLLEDDTVTVVVVDNASTDDTVAEAQRLGVRVLANDANLGFGAGANQGAAEGSAPTLLFLNPDARIEPAALAVLLGRMADQPDLAVVSPLVVHPDGAPQQVWWPFPSAANAWRQALGLHRILRTTSPEGFAIGACLLVRRSAFEALDGFDPRFWLYAEETDLCRRILDAGWNLAVVEEATAVHQGGASGHGAEDLVFEHFHRGAELYVDKHEGRAALVSFRLATLVGASVRARLVADPGERAAHRSRARRSARALLRTPGRVRRDSPGATADHDLVVGSLEAWDDIWRRNQFLVRELLARDPRRRVLFVEPPHDHLHAVRHRGSGSRRRGLRPVPGTPVVRFQPAKLWPRVLGPWADRSLRRQIRRATAACGMSRPTLWVNDPSLAELVVETGWPSLYDMTDDWLRASAPERAHRRLVEQEALLFDRCGAVTVCSPDLAATRHDVRPDLELVPNAVDVGRFQRPQPRPHDLPTGPVAVYVGTLHEDRLDVDLTTSLARALGRRATVVLVGPDSLSSDARGRLTASGVALLGPHPYDDVPAYLQHATVVIVPHVVTPFTESLDPIKAYECLAIGRPTITTPVAGFRDLGAPVVVADRRRFVDEVEAHLATLEPSHPQPVPTWADRAATFAQALEAARLDRPPRPVRVAYVDHCALLSGGELALARLLPALDGVAGEVILGEAGPIEQPLRDGGALVEVLALDPGVRSTRRAELRAGGPAWSQLAAVGGDIVALRRRLRLTRPDLVHTNSLKAALYGGVAARAAGIPVVWHIRDRIAPDYLPRPAVAAVRALGQILPAAVIVNSTATRDTLGPGRARSRATVIWDSVEPATTAVRPAPSDRPFTVAMVGRLAPWKGQDVFLDAFAAAFPDGPQQAVIAGTALFDEDAYADELHLQVDRLGLTDRVRFAGFVEDVPALLASVDAVVHASVIAEPFGQVVIEGMAAGRPVIASAAGGPLDVISDGVDGLLARPGDAADLARQMARLAAEPDLARRIGEAANRRAREFSPERTASKVQAVYAQVLGRPVPPA